MTSSILKNDSTLMRVERREKHMAYQENLCFSHSRYIECLKYLSMSREWGIGRFFIIRHQISRVNKYQKNKIIFCLMSKSLKDKDYKFTGVPLIREHIGESGPMEFILKVSRITPSDGAWTNWKIMKFQ
jgi:hypothetical protein